MSRPKITCFRYKHYDDIYIDGLTFPNDKLLAVLTLIPEQKVIALIEAEVDLSPLISMGCADIQIVAVSPSDYKYAVYCNKIELCDMLSQYGSDNYVELFVAGISKAIIPNELLSSLEYTANSLVKDRVSGMAIYVDFPENQMVISMAKGKYTPSFIKQEIHSIWVK